MLLEGYVVLRDVACGTATEVPPEVRNRGEVVLHALLPCTRFSRFWGCVGKLEDLQPFLESDKVCILLQALSAVVKKDPPLAHCLKSIQDILTSTYD